MPCARYSAHPQIIAQITDLFERNVLKPGDRLPPERELRFQVGRSSLREALRSLSMMGLRRAWAKARLSATRANWQRALQWGFLLDGKKL